MFDGQRKDLTPEQARQAYADFLRDTPLFQAALCRVLAEWPKSCEHFLTNTEINRIAWLGQASMCIATGINFTHRAGFKLLTQDEQRTANETAAAALARWVDAHQDRAIRADVARQGLP